MNRTFDEQLNSNLFPEMPDSFNKKVNDTLVRIGAHGTRHSTRRKTRFLPMRIAAAVIALMIFASGCTFAIRPALAANIPVVNEIVYTLSPETQASEQVCAKIANTVSAVLNSFASGRTADIEDLLKSGDDWVLNNDTFMAAYYLQYLAIREEVQTDGITAMFENVAITNVSAEGKAFRYTADISFDMVLKGDVRKSETARVALEEDVGGFRIVSIEMRSDGFASYMELIQRYSAPEYSDGSLDDNIATYNAYIMCNERQRVEAQQHNQHSGDGGLPVGEAEKIGRLEQLIREVLAADMPDADKQERVRQLEAEIQAIREQATPESVSIENLAAELMYRYYRAQQTGSVPDLSDIMERNEDTDLFFYDVQLAAEKVRLGYLAPLVTVEKGYGEIVEIIHEDDETVTLSMYVKTVIDGGVGEEMILTFRKSENGYIIIGYDRSVGDGVYRNRLKPLAEQYRDNGFSQNEANKRAYEDLLAEAAQFAVDHPELLPSKP